MYSVLFFVFFFFQAEDGIRDYKVTGVQTCALPILVLQKVPQLAKGNLRNRLRHDAPDEDDYQLGCCLLTFPRGGVSDRRIEIGRASCRERVEIWGVAG